MRISKKSICGFLILMLLVNTLSEMPQMTVKASSNMSLEQLQQKFPEGAYWNHAGSSTNNPDGYTWTPCTHHGNCSKNGTDYSGWCGCNSFGLAIQCMGFAHKLAYDAYGTMPSNWNKTSLSNLKAGDVIRYKNNGHSIFVTGVNGDIITYGDCNSDNHCKIGWNKTISKATVQSTLTAVYSAPSELSIGSTVPPSNPQISKNQQWYDLEDTIKITAYADGATRYYMSMFKGEERIKGEHVSGGKFTMAASDYGIGDYSVYFTCSNDEGRVDTSWLTFSVVGEPGYSDVWTSKPIYSLEDTVSISVSPICSKGQVIGIDKNGIERVITEESESIYSVAASQLGMGQYSAYFSVYNGSGSIDTERVEFVIAKPCNLGDLFYAQIRNPNSDMYLANVNGNVEGEVLDCDRSRTWRFERQSDETYKIISSLDEGAMDVTDYGNAGCGTNLQMNSNWDTTAQKFYLYEAYGAYYIKSVCCDMVLDMDQNEPYNLQMWDCRADWANQEFEIIKVDSDDVGVHKYEPTIEKEATCTEDGTRRYTCSVCQDCYTETIVKEEHAYSEEWTVDVEATYMAEGSKSRHCLNCDAKTDVTVIPKLEQDTVVETEGGILSVENVQGQVGETVAVPIKIEKNLGIIAIQYNLQYDSSKVKVVKVESADLLDGSALSTDYTKNPYILSFGDELAETNTLATGTLATIYFEILPEFTEGTTEIELIFDVAYDKDLNEVEFENSSGTIEIKEYIPGDVNGDGQVKLNDAILLRRYVAGWDVTIDLLAGDVNRDGQVKLNDAILLRRYVAGWDVTLK